MNLPEKYSKECAQMLGVKWSEKFEKDFQEVSNKWLKAGKKRAVIFAELPKLLKKHK